jgi:hypothetical protein
MKLIAIVIMALTLTGCGASKVIFRGDCMAKPGEKAFEECIIDAEDYTISLTFNEKKDIWTWKMIPTKWYKGSVQSLSDAVSGLGSLLPLVGQ